MLAPNGSIKSPILVGEDQIIEWNNDLPDPKPSCVHDLIGHNSRIRPNAPAICAWDGQLSYAELETFANCLALRLVQLGAHTEQFVPLCFEKSAFVVISLLAVLKAGAACVLLDPSHPIERLQTMIEDVGAKILLCSPAVRPHFDREKFKGLAFLEVTGEYLKILPDSHEKLPIVKPEDAAIGLFTSGSTGKPKGIIQDHSTAAFSAQTCSRAFGIDSGWRVLQWAAYCFDMSLIDMLMTLVGGGCICVPSEKDKTDNLVQVMREMRVNLVAMTPSFAQTIKSEDLGSLKTLIFGGEPVSKDHLTGWPDNLRIINAYGPAEGSVCVAGPANRECPANVGKAIGSVTWIVDEADPMHLLPVGTIGELLIEGPLLARGYLNDPEKTTASFLRNIPWLIRTRGVADTPRRVYKTGDLARYDQGGSIILMGRKDTQVKLRGQRIETAEVEHIISSLLPEGFSGVVDVVSPILRPESQMLVAFIGAVAKAQSSSDEELFLVDDILKMKLKPHLHGMEGQLKKSLPAYMIPVHFIALRYIPLTSSGKIDRKRLRRIGSDITSRMMQDFPTGTANGSGEFLGASTNISLEKIAELWQSTLGLQTRPINPSSDFFGLGGDSIMAMKLATMARNAGLALSTKEIFKYRTLASMASVTKPVSVSSDLVNGREPHDGKPAFVHDTSKKDIFYPNHGLMSPGIEEITEAPDMQAFMVVCGLLGSHGYINYFAFDLKGSVDPLRVELASKALVEHHSALRTVFGIRTARVVQIVKKLCTLEFQRKRSQFSTEAWFSMLCATEKKCSSKFGDQIVRFLLIERSPSDFTLIMRISHAQFDGTSLGLIYDGLRKAHDCQTLDPVPQFTDFSRVTTTENSEAAEKYWRTLLRSAKMTNMVNHTKPCYANVINKKLFLSILFTGIGRSDITPATVVKAAWALVLAEMASTRDVVFGYAVTGREIPLSGIEKVVGDCNNASLARVVIGESDTIFDLLNRIQTQYIDTVPYQSMGLRQMVEKCTDWPRWTRYSTSVNHQNYTDAGTDTFKLGDAICKISYRDFEVDRRDVQVYSWPPEDGQMRIAVAFCDKLIPIDFAQRMLEALGRTIESFAGNLYARVILSSDVCCRIPLQEPSSSDNGLEDTLPKLYRFGFSMFNPAAIVSNVWNKFLGYCPKDLFEGFDVTDNLAFYAFAGDLVYAAQMSTLYEEEGIGFSIELLIENATKESQRRLLGLVLK